MAGPGPARPADEPRVVNDLDVNQYDLKDPSKKFNIQGILHLAQDSSAEQHDETAVPLETILRHLRSTYSGRVAVEFMALPVR